MTVQAKTESPTIISPETGEPLSRGVRPFTVTYKGQSITGIRKVTETVSW